MTCMTTHVSHLVGGLQDLGAERHNGTQHRQEPENEEDPRRLDPT